MTLFAQLLTATQQIDPYSSAHMPKTKHAKAKPIIESCGVNHGDFTFIQHFPSSSYDTTVQRLTFLYNQLRYIPLECDPRDKTKMYQLGTIINRSKQLYIDRGFNECYFITDLNEIEFIQRKGWDVYVKNKSIRLKYHNY